MDNSLHGSMSLSSPVLRFEEGYRRYPYYCSNRFPTGGYGTKLGPKNTPLHYYQIEFTRPIAEAFLMNSLTSIREELNKELQGCAYVNPDRYAILESMAYQMGMNGLRNFKMMMKAVKCGDWGNAKEEALDSLWARIDSPKRAKRHAEVLLTGDIESVYGGLLV